MISPPKTPSKILNNQEKICEAFEIGRDIFKEWVRLGAPIKKVKGQWYGHYDDIETFMRNHLKKT